MSDPKPSAAARAAAVEAIEAIMTTGLFNSMEKVAAPIQRALDAALAEDREHIAELEALESCPHALEEALFDNHNLRERIAELERTAELSETWGQLYCAVRGIEPVDLQDGSPNWWMFWQDAKMALIDVNTKLAELRERIAALTAALRPLRDATHTDNDGVRQVLAADCARAAEVLDDDE